MVGELTDLGHICHRGGLNRLLIALDDDLFIHFSGWLNGIFSLLPINGVVK